MDLSEVPSQRDGEIGPSRFTRHPWETSRARFFTDVLENSGALTSSPRILDAGAGDAWFAEQLLERHPLVKLSCCDVGYTAEWFDRLVQETGGKIRFFSEVPAEEEYDVLLLMDVLEHIEDASTFLAKLVNDHLVPGGIVLLSVPAWQCLFSRHDTALRHYRRYSPHQLSDAVKGVGLMLLRGGGLFHSLVLPRVLEVIKERLFRHGTDLAGVPPELRWDHGPLFTSAVRSALWLDSLLSRASSRLCLSLPGLTAWCLCRKPA